ncbi:hypothetical protein BSZ36_04470 [Rubricoccus marinus]|uniref:DUF2851 domain-containing protein n=1 Tax=Rubricoccus marinus TaxID=716817 RepID=A0A259U426_9BACT|nr:hypothetical protein BSZ36_04470 [Rubricoccus marinus]
MAEPDAPVWRVPEAVIQDAWGRLLFDTSNLKTTTGEPVVILSPGHLNRGSGPDFSQATVRIGSAPEDLLWAGDIEIHRTSAEWNRHRHGEDPAYARVVLHVVLSPDHTTGTLTRSDGTGIPELVLLPHLDRSLRALVHDFHAQPVGLVPYCSERWGAVPESQRRAFVRETGVERLRMRAQRLAREYGRSPSPERLLIQALFRALGYAPNADAMERLARRLPLQLVRSLDAYDDIYALLIGLAGLADTRFFSEDFGDRFASLASAHALPRSMAPEAWRHGGRPANAPRRRLAQAAALLSAGGLLRDEPLAQLGDALAAEQPVQALRERIRAQAVENVPGIGASRADVILANAVLPVLYLDAELREDHAAEAHVLAALDALPPESDRITRAFEEAGLEPTSALISQGMHQLAEAYCEEGRCARCAIGVQLYPALAGV